MKQFSRQNFILFLKILQFLLELLVNCCPFFFNEMSQLWTVFQIDFFEHFPLSPLDFICHRLKSNSFYSLFSQFRFQLGNLVHILCQSRLITLFYINENVVILCLCISCLLAFFFVFKTNLLVIFVFLVLVQVYFSAFVNLPSFTQKSPCCQFRVNVPKFIWLLRWFWIQLILVVSCFWIFGFGPIYLRLFEKGRIRDRLFVVFFRTHLYFKVVYVFAQLLH